MTTTQQQRETNRRAQAAFRDRKKVLPRTMAQYRMALAITYSSGYVEGLSGDDPRRPTEVVVPDPELIKTSPLAMFEDALA